MKNQLSVSTRGVLGLVFLAIMLAVRTATSQQVDVEAARTAAVLPSGFELLRGCFVPPTGVVYRIGAPGLPATCTHASHTAFAWLAVTPDVTRALATLLDSPVAAAANPPTGTAVVRTLNEGVGDLTIEGGGGLIVNRSGQKITIAPGPSVGIGTNTPLPGFALDVGGAIHASGILKVGNSLFLDGSSNTLTSSTGIVSLSGNSLSTSGTVTSAGGVLTATLLFDGPVIDITTAPNQHLQISPTLNLGIGTASPAEKLDVAGNVKANKYFGDGSGLTSVTSSGLAAGNYANAYSFSNTSNSFSGSYTGNGSGLTNVTAQNLLGGAYSGAYSFPNPLNQFKGTFEGVHKGDGANLSNVTAASLAAGTHTNQFDFNNATNQFKGKFTGDGSGLTGVSTSGLAAGTYSNTYSFNNGSNAFTGSYTGNGAGLTNVTAQNLLAGTYTDAYNFPNPLNQFKGTFEGTHKGDGTNLSNVTAANLNAGTHANQFDFNNASNQFSGKFTGDGSGLTGVSTSGLAAGTYGNAYTFNNPGNAFTGNGSGLTNVTAQTLQSGTQTAAYTFTNTSNAFTGNGAGLTNITAQNLLGGTFTGAYNFSNTTNTFRGVFTGDGSALTGIQAIDASRVAKAGDEMSGTLQFANVTQDLVTPSGEALALMPGGNVGIGTTVPGQKLTVAGMIETTSGGIKFPDGTIQISAPASTVATSWSLMGNAGITPATQFLGTTDAVALHVRVNNQVALRLEPPAAGPGTPNLIGGPDNTVDANLQGVVIAGGGTPSQPNQVQQSFGAIGGGLENRVRAVGNAGTIAGGRSNDAGDEAFVGGGGDNEASGKFAVVAGGSTNVATSEGAAVAGGSSASASGKYSFVAGGMGNRAEADGSIAAGSIARSQHVGAIVFNATTPPLSPPPIGSSAWFSSQADMEFAVHAPGGVRFITSEAGNGPGTAGVFLSSGSGSWSSLSDRNAKHLFEAVDGEAVLGTLQSLPVQRWSYKSQDPRIRHMGPTAQDFRAAFGLGEGATTITGVDVDGVNMAAIQALIARTNRLRTENATLKDELRSTHEKYEALLERLARLENALKR